MHPAFLKELEKAQLISPETSKEILEREKNTPKSVYWELITLFSSGIILFCTGLGIIIYENIDSIGHSTLVAAMVLVVIGCLYYCFKKAMPFSGAQTEHENMWLYYVVVFESLLMTTLIGYIQYQYQLFGTHIGLVAFFSMILLFFNAYYFDNIAVLSLAIINLGSWVGVAIAPLDLLKDNDFTNDGIILSGVALGIFLLAIYFFTSRHNFKRHFALTYKNFATHLLYVSLLAAIFEFDTIWILWFAVLGVVTYYQMRDALRTNSFYFIIFAILYTYVGITGVVFHSIADALSAGFLPFFIMYFMISAAALIVSFIHFNKIVKGHDSV